VPAGVKKVMPVPVLRELAGCPPRRRDVPVGPDDRAQILYTSGTTGPGKGVVLTHRNVLSNARMCCRRFDVRSHDCVAAFLPYHHAFPLTTTVVVPLYAGARVAIGDFTSPRARRLLPQCRPTLLVGVPRVFESLLAGVKRAARDAGRGALLEVLRSVSRGVNRLTGVNVGRLLLAPLHRRVFGGLQLRFCVSGGARLRPETVRQYATLGIPLLQGWGMTELSPVAAAQDFCPWTFYLTRRYERRAGSVGRPLAGPRVRVVKSENPGIGDRRRGIGELVVQGPQVMEKYLDAPEATARRKTDYGLRSSDLALRDERGELRLVGRTQHVIVLPSGKKVFPQQDLHDELASCRCVDEFTIMAVETDDGHERIGMVIRPDVEVLCDAGVRTLGGAYRFVRRRILEALEDKPDYVKNLDICLTRFDGDEFAELDKNAAGEPCPAKNEFTMERSYGRMKESERPLQAKA
jgi:long-chain acyl-CoA synthetase